MDFGEINQRRLRYFREVIQHGSIRSTADALNTAPSVLTRQLRLLEGEIGAVLFERSPRGMIPTEAAHALLDYWRGCESERQAFESTLQQLNGLQTGTVRVGISEGLIDSLLQDVLNDFIQNHPRLQIHLTALPANDIVTEVQNDIVHFGIAYNPAPAPRVVFAASGAYPLRLIVAKSHPLAKTAEPISFGDAIAYPMALMTNAFGNGQIIDALAIKAGVRLTPSLTTNSVAALKRFVESGAGISFMGHSPYIHPPKSKSLVALILDSEIAESAHARLLLRQDRRLPFAAAALLSVIKKKMQIFCRTGATG